MREEKRERRMAELQAQMAAEVRRLSHYQPMRSLERLERSFLRLGCALVAIQDAALKREREREIAEAAKVAAAQEAANKREAVLERASVRRHPFPGPGLGVRILGEVKKPYADLLREADAIFIEELRAAGWYEKVSQAFTVFMPVKSVGVVGDARRYEYVVALRAVETIDFMTARWAHLPYELLETVSNRIINEISGISRVIYDVSSKPPATIEWE